MAAPKKAAKKATSRAPKPAPAPSPAAEPAWIPADPPQAAPPAWQPAPPPATAQPMDHRTYAMLLHLTALSVFLGIPGFIGPLIMWLVRKDQSPFIDAHGREAVNLQISLVLYAVGGFIVYVLLAIVTLGIGALLLLPFVIVGIIALVALGIVLPIIAAVKANGGQPYRFPMTIRFIRPAAAPAVHGAPR